MTKRVTGELTYDAEPSAVYAMFVDPEFVQSKNERTGGSNVTVSVEPEGDGHRIVASRSLPAQLPSFAKKFVGETIDTVETDVWDGPNADGSRNGTIDITFGSAPMSASGTFLLEARGNQTVCSVEIDLKANVPLISGKVEGVASEQVMRAVQAEEAIGREWLANH